MSSKKKKYTKNQIREAEFHDQWGSSTQIDGIEVSKYFTAETSVDFKLAEKLLGSLKNKKILDLGCGLGEASVYFALQGAKVTALDISPKMLECVKKLAGRYRVSPQIKVIESAAESIPCQKNSYDLVFGGNVLHHVNIKKASREIKRILKKDGKAVFIEPLGYNPIIQIYRNLAGDVRTKMEHPFTFKDIREVGSSFKKVNHYEQQLLTTLIFVWFFFGERLNPSKVRYWKRIIDKSEKYAAAFRLLSAVDSIILKTPFINRMCWSTVIELVK